MTSSASVVTAAKSVVSDTTVNFTLKRGSAYCFKMTVVNGSTATPSFTVGNGSVLKTQYVAKVRNAGPEHGRLHADAGRSAGSPVCGYHWINILFAKNNGIHL